MKKSLLLIILVLVVGCGHLEKEAIQKGYTTPNPEFARQMALDLAVNLAIHAAAGPYAVPIWHNTNDRLIWDQDRLRANYPECYRLDERGLYHGWQTPFFCVGEIVETEGHWR